MSDDCFSKIEEMAYLYLAIHCERCDEDFDINSEASEPVEDWAKAVANDAIRAGWTCIDGIVLCPSCIKAEESKKVK